MWLEVSIGKENSDLWGKKGIQVCKNQGAGPHWGPIRGKKGGNIL